MRGWSPASSASEENMPMFGAESSIGSTIQLPAGRETYSSLPFVTS